MIRVLVADDSLLFRNVFVSFLQRDPEIEVIATACDGQEAVELVELHRPDVVTMDVNMPRMTGYEAVEEVMARCPTPIIMVTASVNKEEGRAVMKALALGAVDLISKPNFTSQAEGERAVDEIVSKLKMASKARVVTHLAGMHKRERQRSLQEASPSGVATVVAIAASTGGPAALAKVLSMLPSDLPAAVVVAQHITDGFTPTLVDWLSGVSSLDVREGAPDLALAPGMAVIAPSGSHMTVDGRGRLCLVDSPPVNGCRPAADVLLPSVAEAFGRQVVGVVLTGMGRDGTAGLRAIRDRGGATVAQDQATCVIYGMPKSAIEAGLADVVAPIEEIAGKITRLVRRRVALLRTART